MTNGRPKPPRGAGPRGGRRRPAERPRVGPTARAGRRPAKRPEAPARVRPRLTGRAAVLVLVLSVLVVSYASSLRAYLEQRDELRRLTSEIEQSNADIKALQKEQDRWRDPAYIRQQAREKFGFVMPGEIGYTVLDEDGEPLGKVDALSDPEAETDEGPPQWYDAAWESVLLAGNPPDPDDTPAPVDRITPPKQPKDG